MMLMAQHLFQGLLKKMILSYLCLIQEDFALVTNNFHMEN